MIGFSLQIVGLDGLDAKIAAARQWAQAPFAGSAALRIRDDFTVETTRSFATRGRSTGHAWKALTPAYAAWKQAHYPGRPLMIRTGRLSRSLTDVNNRNFIFSRKSGMRLILGSRVKYGGYHQRGTQRLPARSLFILNRTIAKRWATLLRDDLDKVLERAK